MKISIIITSALFILSSCITQEINESIIFRPTKEFALTEHYKYHQYFIDIDDSSSIETWYMTKPEAQYNIIYFSGNGSNIRTAIPLFNAIGETIQANIFSFNYRGYGQSSGTPTIPNLTRDAIFILEYFQNSINSNDLPNIVVGYSLGGYLAIQTANFDFINAIVTISTFTSSHELENYLRKNALPSIIKPFLKIKVDTSIYQLNNLEKVVTLNKPVLYLHGTNDEFIPSSMSLNLIEKTNSEIKEFHEIHNADHKTIIQDMKYTFLVTEKIQNFIVQNISKLTNDDLSSK